MGVMTDQLDDGIGDTKVLVGPTSGDSRNATPACFLPRGRRLSLASRRSDYAGSQQKIRHEIEGFWVTTFDGLRGTPMVVGESDMALDCVNRARSQPIVE
jgi:hypothetical protein